VNQKARLRIAGDDRRPVLAAIDQRLARIDPLPAVLVVEMTLAAGVEEDGADLRIEEVRLLARRDRILGVDPCRHFSRQIS